MKNLICLSVLLFATLAHAATLEILPSRVRTHAAVQPAIERIVAGRYDLSNLRGLRVQVIFDAATRPLRLIVQSQRPGTHRVDFDAIELDANLAAVKVTANYAPTAEDSRQQLATIEEARCPDADTEFIAFAPNDDATEQQVTLDVAAAARAKGLKTVTLLKSQATRKNYFDYMACPKLKGNFYDGDANPNVIVTADGEITSQELRKIHFDRHVTNIWLACEAYNDPMLSAMTKSARSQKYAAGKNDLIVGPSDQTAKCAMIAAIQGQPITPSFAACVKKYDIPQDHWGLGGEGSDEFGM